MTDFSWEPRGERFAILSTNDPNVGNAGPGVTIKTDVSFYQLDHGGKNDFKLLSACVLPGSFSGDERLLLTISFHLVGRVHRNADVTHEQYDSMVPPRTARCSSYGGIALEVGARILGPRLPCG